MQTDYSTSASGTDQETLVVDTDPPPVRSVRGYVLSCLNIGDGSVATDNDTDNRDTKVAPLSDAALKPIRIQSFKFGAP